MSHLCIFVADSRGNNFDKYKQPQDLQLHYIIQRGATISSLRDKTLDFIKSPHFPNNKQIFIKIAAGINDILKRVHHSDGTESVVSDTFDVNAIISKLLLFRSSVKTLIPSALVGFVTIPTAHLKTIQTENLRSRKLLMSHFTDEEIDIQQFS